MKRWLVCLAAGLLALTAPAQADIVGAEEEEPGVGGVTVHPIRGGRWEITPILTLRVSGGDLFYRGGVAVAYSLNRHHQIGGSFVAGNREYDRRARRDFDALGNQIDMPDVRGNYFTMNENFGSSASAFYRLNLPMQIEKRTFPYLEVFGSRNFWGWGAVSELGGGAGVRRMLSNRTALNTTYGYSVLFADGQRIKRHVVTAGVSMFFR